MLGACDVGVLAALLAVALGFALVAGLLGLALLDGRRPPAQQQRRRC